MRIPRPRPVASGRRRLAVATLVVAFCITLALAIGGTASASAAGPVILPPGQSIELPTGVWGPTTVCVENLGGQGGTVIVDPWPHDDGIYDTIYVGAYATLCISRWSRGKPVKITNNGPSWVRVWSS